MTWVCEGLLECLCVWRRAKSDVGVWSQDMIDVDVGKCAWSEVCVW